MAEAEQTVKKIRPAPPRLRATVQGVYASGVALGSGAAFVFFLREPPRGRTEVAAVRYGREDWKILFRSGLRGLTVRFLRLSNLGRRPPMTTVHGIHHITVIAGDAQENLDFYTGVLGLRLVKRSVNQDVPDTYHLFYADAEGNPGTDLTFFPWPQMPPGRKGAGLAVEVGLAVPEGSLAFWAERLKDHGVDHDAPETRFGERALRLRDPHGLELSLTEPSAPRETAPWRESPVPERHQIRGFHSARLWERDLATTARFLREALGYELVGEDGEWHRFGVDGGGSGKWLEIRELPGGRLGSWGTGAIHHVAFRVADEKEELQIQQKVRAAGSAPTPVIDRFWFRSVYFKEPGGVLFEIATDGPGFTVDEDPAHLGERLILPPWLEPHRREIEAALPPLRSLQTAEGETVKALSGLAGPPRRP